MRDTTQNSEVNIENGISKKTRASWIKFCLGYLAPADHKRCSLVSNAFFKYRST